MVSLVTFLHKLKHKYAGHSVDLVSLFPQKTRYGTYAMLMRAKLQFGTEDLSAFESCLLSEGGLQRAHSSPALPQYSSLKDKGSSSRSRSLKITSTSTKGESQNGTKPDSKAESKSPVS